ALRCVPTVDARTMVPALVPPGFRSAAISDLIAAPRQGTKAGRGCGHGRGRGPRGAARNRHLYSVRGSRVATNPVSGTPQEPGRSPKIPAECCPGATGVGTAYPPILH